ncbi:MULTISPECIES: hypothetical protein [Moorena]|uniref:hypothetical protein n=1 Tax=Moorena TaxID=1155738 RepID=UPI0002EB9A09|nr:MULTISPECIES: hypothetical protein [Moorena]NEP30808.1 hypothetical protein [Moorena sp. SIO3B2]NEP66835.1 hypothetical protein [Moorena sp. SIO3A5]NEQ09097.1 hypothetical protein [Moorena sp. SIO4E2]NER89889.1 hypothetical protein [Moorena sp. SIO3A2]NET68979.1 hypothetical protein [Moorena sp. SIO1G6]
MSEARIYAIAKLLKILSKHEFCAIDWPTATLRERFNRALWDHSVCNHLTTNWILLSAIKLITIKRSQLCS